MSSEPPASNGFDATSRLGRFRPLSALLRAAVSAALILVVVRKVHFGTLLTESRRVPVALIVAVVVMLLVQTLIAAYRWWLIMGHQQVEVPLTGTVRFSFIGAFFNQLLPSSIGGDVARAWYVHQDGYGRQISVITVLIDRIYGMLVLVALAIVLFPVLAYFSISTEALVGAGILVAAALCLLLMAFWLDRLPGAMQKWALVRHLGSLSAATRAIATDRSASAPVCGLSLLVHIITIASTVMLLAAVAPKPNLILCAALVPAITLIAMVPVSIAGWGVREGVMVYGLGLAQVPREPALIVSILFGLSLVAVGLVGGVVFLLESRRAVIRRTTT
jgi:uncharacterized protein (TIRG00374 family)